jgi:MFS family permease
VPSLFPATATPDSRRLIVTRAMRGVGDGAVSVLLPSYLIAIGLTSTQIGIIVFATLFGSALVTLWAGFVTHRFGMRRMLLGAALLMVATGLGFTFARGFWALALVAFVGTMNPSAGDVSLFLPLEQTAISQTVATRDLTAVFAIYNVGGALGGAFGALASGLPTTLGPRLGIDPVAAQRGGFVAYTILAMMIMTTYLWLSNAIEPAPIEKQTARLAKSRSIVMRLSALFSLDSFGGGFTIQSLLALWMFRRFNMSIQAAGTFFFVAGILGSFSQFVSSRMAARFGRINTMVFTHLPANAFLILAALMPTAPLAIACLLIRASMQSMDIPARQSYVMAVVPPEERAAAASVTNVPRSLASAVAPIPAGMLLDATSFGWPLICAGTCKIAYDLLLLLQFRAHRPEDERV